MCALVSTSVELAPNYIRTQAHRAIASSILSRPVHRNWEERTRYIPEDVGTNQPGDKS
jgi:hypothetical protein